MHGIFDYDGPIFRILNLMYCLVLLNFLWLVFSIPVFTIGAATTALFSVTGKIVRQEGVHVFKDFTESFRSDFKQSTIIWLILFTAGIIIYFNIKNISVYGRVSPVIFVLQIAVLFELIIIYIYIFLMISEYSMGTKDLFRLSFIMGNRFILSTLMCIASFAAVLLIIYELSPVFMLVLMSLYAYSSYYIIRPVFKKFIHFEK